MLPNAHRGRRMNLNACDGGMNPQINWGRGDSICVESGMDLDFLAGQNYPKKFKSLRGLSKRMKSQ